MGSFVIGVSCLLLAMIPGGASGVATSEGSRSFWPLSLSDIETYLSQIIRPTERKTEPRSGQPSERPVTEQPR
jgi:hypothetical protein